MAGELCSQIVMHLLEASRPPETFFPASWKGGIPRELKNFPQQSADSMYFQADPLKIGVDLQSPPESI
jgi:hypothetical protein